MTDEEWKEFTQRKNPNPARHSDGTPYKTTLFDKTDRDTWERCTNEQKGMMLESLSELFSAT